jgi:ankyrin repeat protein
MQGVGAHRCNTLHLAARHCHPVVVHQLLAAGASLEAADVQGHTPLHIAALAGRCGVVQQLLAAGSNLAAADAEGRTPLHSAAISENKPA